MGRRNAWFYKGGDPWVKNVDSKYWCVSGYMLAIKLLALVLRPFSMKFYKSIQYLGFIYVLLLSFYNIHTESMNLIPALISLKLMQVRAKNTRKEKKKTFLYSTHGLGKYRQHLRGDQKVNCF